MKTEKVTKDVLAVFNVGSPTLKRIKTLDGGDVLMHELAIPATLTYEVPREPLRWEGEMTIDAALSARLWFCSFVTKEGTQTNDIEPFIGKRTRVTIEEVE